MVCYGTGMLGTGMDVVPNLPKCPVPVLLSCRTYQVSCTGIDVPNLPKCPVPEFCNGTGGTGIHIVPDLPKSPVS